MENPINILTASQKQSITEFPVSEIIRFEEGYASGGRFFGY
jgi:hypothetical protein